MNLKHTTLALTVGLGLALAACGGSVVAEQTGGNGTGAGTTATGASTTGSTSSGTGAGTTGAGGSASTGPCPVAEPSPGASCKGVPALFECSYGASVRPECRRTYTCDNDAWATPHSACAEYMCPSLEPGAQVQCPDTGSVCAYDDDLCYCGCAGGIACVGAAVWQCATPPTTAGCPPAIPNNGAACTDPGVQCNYGVVCTPDFAIATCTAGVWSWNTMIACGG